LVQTRVPRELESRIKEEAQRRRLSVSQLVRNLLEDTVDLVDGVLGGVDEIVADSMDLAENVGRDALRVARAATRGGRRMAEVFEQEASLAKRRRKARGGGEDGEPIQDRGAADSEPGEAADSGPEAPATEPGDAFAHIDAWNPVIMNQAVNCSRCGASIRRGSDSYAGLGDGPIAWLCTRCIREL
jgi:hypothetical protein